MSFRAALGSLLAAACACLALLATSSPAQPTAPVDVATDALLGAGGRGTVFENAPDLDGGMAPLLDRKLFCKQLKALVKSSAKDFANQRGELRDEYRNSTAQVWAAKTTLQPFDYCSIFSSEELGVFYRCDFSKAPCAEASQKYALAVGAMKACLENWNYIEPRHNSLAVIAEHEGVRVTVEKTNDYRRCDTTLSIETYDY